MTDHDHGPPDEKARYASRGNRANPNSFPISSNPDYTANGIPLQLRRRRGASWRLPPLDCGYRDPMHCEPPGVRGYEDAAAMLLSLGLTPAPNLPALRVMWKAGDESRRVVEVIGQRWEMTA
jgi:hypothetical protein